MQESSDSTLKKSSVPEVPASLAWRSTFKPTDDDEGLPKYIMEQYTSAHKPGPRPADSFDLQKIGPDGRRSASIRVYLSKGSFIWPIHSFDGSTDDQYVAVQHTLRNPPTESIGDITYRNADLFRFWPRPKLHWNTIAPKGSHDCEHRRGVDVTVMESAIRNGLSFVNASLRSDRDILDQLPVPTQGAHPIYQADADASIFFRVAEGDNQSWIGFSPEIKQAMSQQQWREQSKPSISVYNSTQPAGEDVPRTDNAVINEMDLLQ